MPNNLKSTSYDNKKIQQYRRKDFEIYQKRKEYSNCSDLQFYNRLYISIFLNN